MREGQGRDGHSLAKDIDMLRKIWRLAGRAGRRGLHTININFIQDIGQHQTFSAAGETGDVSDCLRPIAGWLPLGCP